MARAAQLRGVAPQVQLGPNADSAGEAAAQPDDDVVLLLERAKDSKSAALRAEYLQKCAAAWLWTVHARAALLDHALAHLHVMPAFAGFAKHFARCGFVASPAVGCAGSATARSWTWLCCCCRAVNKLALLPIVLPPSERAATSDVQQQQQLRAARSRTVLWADITEVR